MMKLRRAVPADVDHLLQIKAALMYGAGDRASSQGGFLLGSSADQYLSFIQQAIVWVLEDQHRDQLAGFAIGIPDPVLRHSELWQRRQGIQWFHPIASELEGRSLAYIEQLAVLPERSYRFYAPALALALVQELLHEHEFLLTTVVEKPIMNLAARAMLVRWGAEPLGTVQEVYPSGLAITSLVYGGDRSTCLAHLDTWMPRQRLARMSALEL